MHNLGKKCGTLVIGTEINSNDIYIAISAKESWRGFLRFDQERHLNFMNAPYNFPRINTTPQWFTIKPEETYQLIINNKNLGIKKGSELLQGLEIDIK